MRKYGGKHGMMTSEFVDAWDSSWYRKWLYKLDNSTWDGPDATRWEVLADLLLLLGVIPK